MRSLLGSGRTAGSTAHRAKRTRPARALRLPHRRRPPRLPHRPADRRRPLVPAPAARSRPHRARPRPGPHPARPARRGDPGSGRRGGRRGRLLGDVPRPVRLRGQRPGAARLCGGGARRGPVRDGRRGGPAARGVERPRPRRDPAAPSAGRRPGRLRAPGPPSARPGTPSPLPATTPPIADTPHGHTRRRPHTSRPRPIRTIPTPSTGPRHPSRRTATPRPATLPRRGGPGFELTGFTGDSGFPRPPARATRTPHLATTPPPAHSGPRDGPGSDPRGLWLRLPPAHRPSPASRAVVLAAADPANAYGAALPWPEPADRRRAQAGPQGGLPGGAGRRRADALHGARRQDPARLALRTRTAHATDDPRLQAAAEALAAAARAGSLGTVTVERVNGASALTSPIGTLLEGAGFIATPRGLRLRA